MSSKFIIILESCGLGVFIPLIKLIRGEDRAENLQAFLRGAGLPILALAIFFGIWAGLSTQIQTSVGKLPSPAFVWRQAGIMWQTYRSEKVNKAQFAAYESTRSELHAAFTARSAAVESGALGESLAKIDADRAELVNKIKEQAAMLEADAAGLQKVVDEAEAVKLAEIENKTNAFIAAKRVILDDDGEISKDPAGNPLLQPKAAEIVGALRQRRVMVYESTVARIYADSAATYAKLGRSSDKIESCIATIATLSTVADSQKKISSQLKKQTAYQKQIGKTREYSGNGSIVDYVGLSIITVLFGFALAAIIAIPTGILCGLSPTIMTALAPLIQVFRPVSPLAWVLITIQVVDGVFVGDAALTGDIFKNTFLHAAITVALCSLWATLSNTALGVSSIDPDHLNVAKVLRLGWFSRVFKIVIPSAIPYIFTGLRITLGVGWMVLIVSEMMATSRGLGWFIDQQYQNNKVESLANIIVCIFIIGLIGALLDRIMSTMQRLVSFDDQAAA